MKRHDLSVSAVAQHPSPLSGTVHETLFAAASVNDLVDFVCSLSQVVRLRDNRLNTSRPRPLCHEAHKQIHLITG
jgi:hypothetical protein